MAEERKVFHDSIVPIPVQSGLAPNGMMVQATTPSNRAQSMTLLFSFALPEELEAELEAKVAKGETVSPESLNRHYAVSRAHTDALVAWLEAQSFTIDEVATDNTSVYATASVSQIEKSLDVEMVRVAIGGFSYVSARNAPSLPMSVGAPVQSIVGLQPFRRANKHCRHRHPTLGNHLALGALVVPTPTPSIANKPPYLVSEVMKAYNADGLPVDGSGQTIAILIDTFPADSDLQGFWSHNGIANNLSRIQKINVNGGQLPAPSGEETLDAEWTSGIASGATIRIYASSSLAFVDLDRALDRIVTDIPSQPGMRQLSISLGLGETYLGGPTGEVAVQHQKFLKLSAAGVNVFVSTGDAGSNPDQTGQSSTGPLQVEYESSDPNVVAVGGTTLRLAMGGSVSSETGWSHGGGGKSVLFPRPTWQKGTGITGKQRLVPDVSCTADPDEGAFVFLDGSVQQFGGTSWSAPVWAAFCALINASRVHAGKKPLGFLNPLIYPLAATGFRDITSGSNGAYKAVKGYDLVTGLGVPNVKALIKALGSGSPSTVA